MLGPREPKEPSYPADCNQVPTGHMQIAFSTDLTGRAFTTLHPALDVLPRKLGATSEPPLEGQGYGSTGRPECWFDAVAVMNVDIDVENSSPIPMPLSRKEKSP